MQDRFAKPKNLLGEMFYLEGPNSEEFTESIILSNMDMSSIYSFR